MQATIPTSFLNEKINKIYSFCSFSTWNNTRQMHLEGVLWQKTVTPPPIIPLKDGVKTKLFLFVYLVIITTTLKQ